MTKIKQYEECNNTSYVSQYITRVRPRNLHDRAQMLNILVNNESAQFSCCVCAIHQTAKVCKVEHLALLKRVYINVKT